MPIADGQRMARFSRSVQSKTLIIDFDRLSQSLVCLMAGRVRVPEIDRHDLRRPVAAELVAAAVPDEYDQDAEEETETETSGKADDDLLLDAAHLLTLHLKKCKNKQTSNKL